MLGESDRCSEVFREMSIPTAAFVGIQRLRPFSGWFVFTDEAVRRGGGPTKNEIES